MRSQGYWCKRRRWSDHAISIRRLFEFYVKFSSILARKKVASKTSRMQRRLILKLMPLSLGLPNSCHAFPQKPGLSICVAIDTVCPSINISSTHNNLSNTTVSNGPFGLRKWIWTLEHDALSMVGSIDPSTFTCALSRSVGKIWMDLYRCAMLI